MITLYPWRTTENKTLWDQLVPIPPPLSVSLKVLCHHMITNPIFAGETSVTSIHEIEPTSGALTLRDIDKNLAAVMIARSSQANSAALRVLRQKLGHEIT